MASWSGLWNHVGGEDYSFNTSKGTGRAAFMRLMRKRGMREMSEVMKTLLDDATPASTASVTYSRIAHVADPAENVNGGAATIETHELMGAELETTYTSTGAKTARAVTAADVTSLQAMLEGGTEQDRNSNAYPTDASGNGGGGKGEYAG